RDTLPEFASLGSQGPDAFVAVIPHAEQAVVEGVVDLLKRNFDTLVLETHGVKALVDVDVRFVAFDKDHLPRTAQAALAAIN
ncbi:MAG TPA: hypothetical protein VFV39_01750, partial [Limnobacter sp.]|nr:hypothetical protein [Limnobacter sp.]